MNRQLYFIEENVQMNTNDIMHNDKYVLGLRMKIDILFMFEVRV